MLFKFKIRYLLIMLIFILCSWKSPVFEYSNTHFNSIEDIDQSSSLPDHWSLVDLNWSWKGIYLNQAYIKPFLGPCDSKHVDNCVQYTYLAVYKAFDGDISYRNILAITYWGELAIFGHSGQKLKMISYEALFRNFFDAQGGGCRYNHSDDDPIFDCRYANFITWLATSQHWRDAAVISADGQYIRVNLQRLLGIPVSEIGSKTLRGYMGFDKDPFINMVKNLNLWRNGQGSDVPSTWGNTRLAAGATSYTALHPNEDKGHIIIHYYSDRKATIGDDVPETPSCTLVSVITTVDGRLPGLSTCQP